MTRSVGIGVATVLGAVAITRGSASPSAAPQSKAHGALTAEQVIGTWKPTPQDVAKKMIAKYGQPQEVTANRPIWHNNGPCKIAPGRELRMGAGIPPAGSSPARQQQTGLNRDATLRPAEGEGEKIRRRQDTQ